MITPKLTKRIRAAFGDPKESIDPIMREEVTAEWGGPVGEGWFKVCLNHAPWVDGPDRWTVHTCVMMHPRVPRIGHTVSIGSTTYFSRGSKAADYAAQALFVAVAIGGGRIRSAKETNP